MGSYHPQTAKFGSEESFLKQRFLCRSSLKKRNVVVGEEIERFNFHKIGLQENEVCENSYNLRSCTVVTQILDITHRLMSTEYLRKRKNCGDRIHKWLIENEVGYEQVLLNDL
jgi:hypothetical protein